MCTAPAGTFQRSETESKTLATQMKAVFVFTPVMYHFHVTADQFIPEGWKKNKQENSWSGDVLEAEKSAKLCKQREPECGRPPRSKQAGTERLWARTLKPSQQLYLKY